MDLATIAHLTGVPGLGAAASLLESTATGIQNVKVHKQQCSDMRGRCLNLMVALTDSSEGLEGTKVIEIADEIELIMHRIDRKLKEWGAMSQLRSFLAQREIRDGIDSLNRDIDEANMRFSIMMNMEIARGQIQSKAIQERDKAEMRELLQHIVTSTNDMKVLLNMQSSHNSHPVEEIMESLQTELMDPSLDSTEEEVFKAGLWELHEKTAKLPPLTDLTGQVDIGPQVTKGTFNDIFSGRWLDKEAVALRLPRTIANSPEDQRDFQKEVELWRRLSHDNVMPLYGVVYQNHNLYSVSPWMDNGSVSDYVKNNPTVDRIKLLTDAAMGLEYLHQKGIVHGDVRGANLLISKVGTARLSDFGFSKFLEDCGKGMTSSSNNINPRWFAPELLQQTGPVSVFSDVWSFGMLCLEVLSGRPPYARLTRDVAVLREVDNGRLPEHPGRAAVANGLSEEMWTLMGRCWSLDPRKRPPMGEVRTKLLWIRGLVGPLEIDHAPKESKPVAARVFGGLFSKTTTTTPTQQQQQQARPRTADSAMSKSSSFSAKSNMSSSSFGAHRQQQQRHGTFASGIEEHEEILSPLDIQGPAAAAAAGLGYSASSSSSLHHHQKQQQNSRPGSVSSSSTPSIYIDRQPSLYTPAPATAPPGMSGRSSSSGTITAGGAARKASLAVPSASSSLPASFGSYFPDRRGSVDSQGQGNAQNQGQGHAQGNASPIKSVLSAASSHLSGPAREAVTDPRAVVNLNEAGMVTSGTLEGFVQRLITHFNSRKDAEFRDVLFTACADFTTPEDLFGVLSRRFHEAEVDYTQHPEDRVAVQYNIFLIIMYWLSNRNLPVDHQLMWQMRSFCETAIRVKTSATMHDKAGDLLALIETRAHADALLAAAPLSPGRPRLSAAQILPSHLAVALCLLEGDKYKALVPADYVAHIRRHAGYNNLEALYTANNKIAYWVKDSILHYEKVEHRTDVLKFFIHTANECLKRRNFSSLMAIASALHSAPIDRLKLTKAGLKPELKSRLKFFEAILQPTANHRGYRDALNNAATPQERDQCIPWLAIHLKELHSVLYRYPATVEVQGRPMINFERYVKFMDRVREVAHYKPPNLEPYRTAGYLEYLETQLRNVRITPDSDDQMMTRSKMIEARETMEYRTRKPQLKTLGFRTT